MVATFLGVMILTTVIRYVLVDPHIGSGTSYFQRDGYSFWLAVLGAQLLAAGTAAYWFPWR